MYSKLKTCTALNIFFFSLWSSVSVPKCSTTETMKTLPFLGQFLGRLCWNPYVTAGGEFTLWTASSPSVVALKATRQAHVIMTVMILTWFVMCCVAVVVRCLQIQAEGCCSSVCGDCTQSNRVMLWKEKPTSGYRYNFKSCAQKTYDTVSSSFWFIPSWLVLHIKISKSNQISQIRCK